MNRRLDRIQKELRNLSPDLRAGATTAVVGLAGFGLLALAGLWRGNPTWMALAIPSLSLFCGPWRAPSASNAT